MRMKKSGSQVRLLSLSSTSPSPMAAPIWQRAVDTKIPRWDGIVIVIDGIILAESPLVGASLVSFT